MASPSSSSSSSSSSSASSSCRCRRRPSGGCQPLKCGDAGPDLGPRAHGWDTERAGCAGTERCCVRCHDLMGCSGVPIPLPAELGWGSWPSWALAPTRGPAGQGCLRYSWTYGHMIRHTFPNAFSRRGGAADCGRTQMGMGTWRAPCVMVLGGTTGTRAQIPGSSVQPAMAGSSFSG